MAKRRPRELQRIGWREWVLLPDLCPVPTLVATIYDPFGKRRGRIVSPIEGIVIGHTQHPLVNRGDAIAHIAAPLPDAEG